MSKFQPDFNEFLKVLKKEKPSRPVLYELFMNNEVYSYFSRKKPPIGGTDLDWQKFSIDGFHAAGYDYAMVSVSHFHFPSKRHSDVQTISLNDGFMVTDEESFGKYPWVNPDDCDYTNLKAIGEYLPEGMKVKIMGPGGVLENVIALTGYDNLCYLIYDEPELVQQLFDSVGSRLLRHYEKCLEYDCVGVIMSNDDWGFKTQTMLSVEQMRKYVFPWHKKIADLAHKNNRPVLLHSCGYAEEIMDDIIDFIGFDGKHSYEDIILPVEENYKRWGDRIAILGGIDVDLLTRGTAEEIKARCNQMLDLAEEKGSYALGSGNSIPTYIPIKNYAAMIETAWDRR